MYPRNYSADGADDISRYEVGFVKAFSPELLLLSGCNISVHVLYFVLFHHVFLAYFLSVGCPLYFLILVFFGLYEKKLDMFSPSCLCNSRSW